MVLQLQRRIKKYPNPLTGDLEVFITDWHSEDAPIAQDDDEDEASENRDDESGGRKKWKPYDDQFVIKAFGLDNKGNSIAIDVTDFKPYFFIKVPDTWERNVATVFMNGLKELVHKAFKDTLKDWKLLNAKQFYYFTGDERYKFKFIKLTFDSQRGYNQYEYLLKEKVKIVGINGSAPTLYDRYESNILPLLRFIHTNDLNATGWITIPHGKYIKTINETTCQLQVIANYQHVKKLESDEIPPINYMSYDIEGDSSHGDFPIADKDYLKLARDLITEYNRLHDEAIVYKKEHKKNMEFDIRGIINKLVQLAFDPNFNNNNVRSVKTIDNEKPTVESSEFVTDSFIEIINNNDIDDSYKQDQLLELFEMNFPLLVENTEVDYYSLADQLIKECNRLKKNNNVKYSTHQRDVVKLLFSLAFDDYYDNNAVNVVYPLTVDRPTDRKIQCLVPTICDICNKCRMHQIVNKHKKRTKPKPKPGEIVISQDYFVEQLNKLFMQHFPPLQGDPIIQIGSVLKKYGEKDPYLKHIITLGTCAPIDNKTMIDHENKDITLADDDIVAEMVKARGVSANEIKKSMTDPVKKAEFNAFALEKRKELQYGTDKSDVVVESYKTESEVLLAWIKLVRESDPDLIIGYNIFGFDFKYIYGRAKMLGIADEFNKIGRIEWIPGKAGKKDDCVLKEQKLSSSGLGDNTLYYLQMHGRVCIDLYKVAQSSFNLESYKLDFVCKKYLGKSKNDLPPSEIFIKQKGDEFDRRTIAEYCLIDCILVTRFIDKLDIIINTIGMSQVCSVPFSFLFLRGQGIKLLSFVSKICRTKGYIIPVLKKDDDGDCSERYEGAIVLNAQNDIYYKPIAVADFNSLYPSCMISENLSHDSYIGFKVVTKGADTNFKGIPLNPENEFEKMLLAGSFPGWDYVDVVYDVYDYVPVAPGKKKKKKIVTAHKICRFAQPPNGAKSVVPTILQELLDARASTREKQKAHQKGSFKYNVLEGLQLAYKVTANSLYGQIGARTSAIFLMDIAACTTATGRNLIKFSKNYCEKNYIGAQIIYGDSVASYTPVTIKEGDKIGIVRIMDLADKWSPVPDSDKEYCDLDAKNIMSWTDSGWTKINRVIRHKLSSTKKMIRVLTHTGLVDVTDDHSLLRKDGAEVSPKDLKIGDELLHVAYPGICANTGQYDVNEARILGFFMGDGSCGCYDCKSGSKSSWALNNADMELLEFYQGLCEKVYPLLKWVIAPTMVSSGVFKLSPRGKVLDFIKRYRALMYTDKEKRIPEGVLNGSIAVRQAFWDGFYDADGDKDTHGYIRTDQKNQTTCAQLALLGASLGYNISLNDRSDKLKICRITLTKQIPRKNTHAIKKMYQISYNCTDSGCDGYVYDLTTQNHHFQAGIGQMIVHNTDSIFVKFETKDMYGNELVGLDAIYKSMELCVEAAVAISRQLKRPHNLDFEKAIWPFVLVSKKRYHGHYYTIYGEPKYDAKSMGIVLKRRDNAKIVKHIFGGMMKIIMEKHSISEAIKFVKTECKKLLDGKFTMDFFVLTKTLRSYYKSPDQIAHNVLAQRIGKRDPGNKPQGNDRIPFAHIRVADPDCLQGDRIETPEFIKEHDLDLDYSFYLTNQIMKPVTQIIELVMSNANALFTNILTDYDNELIGAQKLTKYPGVVKMVNLNAVKAKDLHMRYLNDLEKREALLKEHGEFEGDYVVDEDDDTADAKITISIGSQKDKGKTKVEVMGVNDDDSEDPEGDDDYEEVMK